MSGQESLECGSSSELDGHLYLAFKVLLPIKLDVIMVQNDLIMCIFGNLCNPTDCSLPGTSVHGDSPGILEWVAMPTSRGSSQPRDQTQISHIPGGFFTVWATTPDLHNLDGPDKFKLWVQYDKVKHSFSIDRHTIYNLTFLRVLTYLGNFCSFCQYYYSQLKTNYGHYKIPVPLTFPKLYHFSSKMVTPLLLNLGGFDCNQ